MPRQKRNTETKALFSHVKDAKIRKGNCGTECGDFVDWLREVRRAAEDAMDKFMDVQDSGEHPEIRGRVYELKAKAAAILDDCDKAKRHINRVRQAMAEMDDCVVFVDAQIKDWEDGEDEAS